MRQSRLSFTPVSTTCTCSTGWCCAQPAGQFAHRRMPQGAVRPDALYIPGRRCRHEGELIRSAVQPSNHPPNHGCPVSFCGPGTCLHMGLRVVLGSASPDTAELASKLAPPHARYRKSPKPRRSPSHNHHVPSPNVEASSLSGPANAAMRYLPGQLAGIKR